MTEEAWTIRRVLAWAGADLKERGSSSGRLDAELLLAEVLATTRVGLVMDADRPLAKEELARYRALHKRRRAGEPIAYLLGRREFYGRMFAVDRRVLVPRPETEILVEVALRRTGNVSLSSRTLDLCTGSGCVAITLGRERPTARVIGTDISEDALAVAAKNAHALGAYNVSFFRSDLFGALGPPLDRFELVTANPPYIPDDELPTLMPDVRDYEPRLALAGGRDGLDVVREIVAEAPRWLVSGGVLALELCAGQAPEVRSLFEAAGFGDVETTLDYARHERVVSGRSGGRTS